MGNEGGCGVGIALVVSALVPFSSSTALCTDEGGDGDGGDGNAQEPGPQGWTDMGTIARILSSIDGIRFHRADSPAGLGSITPREDHLLLFLGADRNITDRERTAFEDFVLDGGTGMLACDDGRGDRISSRFDITLSDHRVIATNFEFNWSFIPSQLRYGGEDYRLLFNNPMAIFSHNEGSYPLASSVQLSPAESEDPQSTVGSVADMNDNDELDMEDRVGPISLMEMLPPDDGRPGTFILVGDTGIFNDDLLELHDNRPFVVHLVTSLLPGGGYVTLYTGAQSGVISPNILYGG